MSARSAAAVATQEVPRVGTGSLLAAAAAIVCPFDCVLAGMIRAGLGVEAICAFLGISRAVLDHNLVRLDLPMPHDRPRRKGGRRAWEDDETRFAIYRRCQGIHPESIGLPFGRSAPSVRRKMHQLGVPTPDRKKLHRVDAATLDRTLPDFGFPVPPEDRDDPAATTPPGDIFHNDLPIVSAKSDDSSPATAPTGTRKGTRTRRNVDVPGQRDLTLLTGVPASKSEPTDFCDVVTVATSVEDTIEADLPVCNALDDNDVNKAQVLGPADLIDKHHVVGKVRHPDTNKSYLIWLTLLYRGGMHYKAMSAYLGLSPSAVQTILYRMQIPRGKNRSSFGWTCDLECAVAELAQWDFVLVRCMSNPELPDHQRPLFWRHRRDKGMRTRRCTRLKNNEIEDFFKYKEGNSIEIMTRAQLEAQRRHSNSGTGNLHPARLHASVQDFLPIQQGATNEQFALRGHASVGRSGFSRDARDQMPWAHPRNGSATRSVYHP
jgi:hypothetical protein